MKAGKQLLRLLPVLVLLVYSVVLLWIEASTSQEYVRRYFTDIGHPPKRGYFAAPTGDTLFYAVNTSLSAFLLGSAGILLLFASFGRQSNWSRQTTLYAGQGAVLLWLCIDDRFMLHEQVGERLGIPSTLILGAALLVNLVVYALAFRLAYFSERMASRLILAAAAFALMMTCDLALPHDMPLRLSLEDLSKTWAGFAFLAFAWETARFSLIGQPAGEESLRLPPVLSNWLPSRGC